MVLCDFLKLEWIYFFAIMCIMLYMKKKSSPSAQLLSYWIHYPIGYLLFSLMESFISINYGSKFNQDEKEILLFKDQCI